MKPPAVLVAAACSAALLLGCGGSSGSTSIDLPAAAGACSLPNPDHIRVEPQNSGLDTCTVIAMLVITDQAPGEEPKPLRLEGPEGAWVCSGPWTSSTRRLRCRQGSRHFVLLRP